MKRLQHKRQWGTIRARRKEKGIEGGASENNEGATAGGTGENNGGATDENIEEDEKKGKKETRALGLSGHAQSGWGARGKVRQGTIRAKFRQWGDSRRHAQAAPVPLTTT